MESVLIIKNKKYLNTVDMPNLDAKILEAVLFPVPEVPPKNMINGCFLSVKDHAI